MQARRIHHIHHPHAHGRNLNMVEGPLLGKVLIFALPLMLTNLLQTFYSAADMMVVSLSPEANAVGAIGTTGAMINLILNIFIGLSVGTNVVVARRLGAGDREGTSRAVHTALIVSVVFGLIDMAVGLTVSRPLLIWMGAQESVLDLAVLYTKIYFLGLPFISLTNFLISIFRAKGDTQTPLFVLTATGLLNVGLNLFFVLVVRLSVEGVAIATMVANAASAVILLVRLGMDSGFCRFSFRRLRFDKTAFRDMVFIGLPAGAQGALFSLSNMIILSSILKVNNATVPPGETFQPVVNGNAAGANLEGFVYTATNSIYQAAITFTSQNVGAGKYRRVWRVMGTCYLVTTVVAFIFGGATLLFHAPLLSLYGIHRGEPGSLTRMAYDAAYTRLTYMLSVYFLLSTMEVGSGILRGLGRSLTSTLVSLVGSCLLRIVWIATVFEAHQTLGSIYISYPISWGLTALAHFTCAVIVLKSRIKKQKAEAQSAEPEPNPEEPTAETVSQ